MPLLKVYTAPFALSRYVLKQASYEYFTETFTESIFSIEPNIHLNPVLMICHAIYRKPVLLEACLW